MADGPESCVMMPTVRRTIYQEAARNILSRFCASVFPCAAALRNQPIAFALSAGHPNDTILLIGRVTYVGHTSMEVCVETYVESLSGEKTRINKAYLVMVALDENEKPVEVPGLVVETHRQRMDWEAGEKRYEYRRNLRRHQTP